MLSSNIDYRYARPSQVPSNKPAPPPQHATDITFKFSDIPDFSVSGSGPVTVTDIWSGAVTKVTSGQYTAKAVPFHGTAFLTIEA